MCNVLWQNRREGRVAEIMTFNQESRHSAARIVLVITGNLAVAIYLAWNINQD